MSAVPNYPARGPGGDQENRTTVDIAAFALAAGVLRNRATALRSDADDIMPRYRAPAKSGRQRAPHDGCSLTITRIMSEALRSGAAAPSLFTVSLLGRFRVEFSQ